VNAKQVLVTIEMFNALNAVTESKSLLQMPPWYSHPPMAVTVLYLRPLLSYVSS